MLSSILRPPHVLLTSSDSVAGEVWAVRPSAVLQRGVGGGGRRFVGFRTPPRHLDECIGGGRTGRGQAGEAPPLLDTPKL